MKKHIHPIFHKILQREDKEALLHQKAKVIWLLGLSGAGKSTIAQGLEKKLYQDGVLTQILDGDNLRSGLNKNLTFTEVDRTENIRRVAEVAKLFLNCGVVTIASFICPTREIQALVKEIVGAENFIEVFIQCPIEVCEERDVKGLYAKARTGEIKNFTGISSPFEAPSNPSLVIETAQENPEDSIEKLYQLIKPLLQHS